LRSVWIIARRDLAAYLRAPAGLAVAALFLALEGMVFWMFVRFLGRPDAPPGGLMEYFFGGTLLYWVAVALLATVLPMRLLAEEQRSGTLETLLTAPVRVGEVVAGKWLAAWTFFALLWAPTLLYLPFLGAAGAAIDAGAVAAGYLGTMLVGGAVLAIGVCASAATRHQLAAAAGSFVALFLVLLGGALEGQASSPGAAALARRVSLFRMMEDFGHGIVDTRSVLLLATLAALALAGAIRLVGRDRPVTGGDRGGGAVQLAAAALVLVIAVLTNVLGGRHFLRGDWTAAGLYELSPKTRAVLAELPRPVAMTVFLYPRSENEEDRLVAGLLRELLLRMQQVAGDRMSVEYVDPDRAPARAEQVQRTHGISPYELSQGVVVVASGARARYVPRDDLADEGTDDVGGARRMRAFRGEAALLSALLTVNEDRAPTVCFLQGHGEPSIDSFEDGGYASFAEDLRRDAFQVRGVDLPRSGLRAAGALAPPGAGPGIGCDALVIAEVQSGYAATELETIGRYLDGGGRLLLAQGPVFDRTGTTFLRVGVEPLAARFGIVLGDAVLVDPVRGSDVEGPSVWIARREGYGHHPVTARLGGRPTTWARARPLERIAAATAPTSPTAAVVVTALVSSGPDAWGETDLATIRGERDLVFDAAVERRGPLAVAMAAEMPPMPGADGRPARAPRAVVLGTGRLVTNDRLSGLLVRDFNRDLALSAIAWLTDRPERAGVGPKVPADVRLSLDTGTATRAFVLYVVALPLLALGLGIFAWWRRRV
jgi:ABC-2 type transport system permease protein